MINTAKNVLILLLVLVVGFFILSPNDVRDNTSSVSRVDTFYKHDTLRKYKKGDSIPFAVLDTIYLVDSIKIHDTPQMIYDYLSVKAYSDTLHINKDNWVYIKDTISQNKIFGRGYESKFTEKTITITNEVYPKSKNELFLGMVGDMRRFDEKIGIGVGIVYKKKREAYVVSFTTNQISLGLYKKLF